LAAGRNRAQNLKSALELFRVPRHPGSPPPELLTEKIIRTGLFRLWHFRAILPQSLSRPISLKNQRFAESGEEVDRRYLGVPVNFADNQTVRDLPSTNHVFISRF
jgi:hypothetical protein